MALERAQRIAVVCDRPIERRRAAVQEDLPHALGGATLLQAPPHTLCFLPDSPVAEQGARDVAAARGGDVRLIDEGALGDIGPGQAVGRAGYMHHGERLAVARCVEPVLVRGLAVDPRLSRRLVLVRARAAPDGVARVLLPRLPTVAAVGDTEARGHPPPRAAVPHAHGPVPAHPDDLRLLHRVALPGARVGGEHRRAPVAEDRLPHLAGGREVGSVGGQG